MRASAARSVRGLACMAVAALASVAACGATTDSLGYNNTESKTLLPLTPPASYPNPFRDLLGQTDAAISAKLNNAFNTIFHGSPSYAIYVPVGTDQAYIEDTFHDNEIRTEGIGLGMMICVEFNKQDEFDKLWRYAREVVQNQSGPDAGYFPSFCDAAAGTDDQLPRSVRLRAVRHRAHLRQRSLGQHGGDRLRDRCVGAVPHAAPQGGRQRRRRRRRHQHVRRGHQPAARRPQRRGGGRDAPVADHAGILRALGRGRRRSASGPRRPSAVERSGRATPTRRPGSCRCAPASTGRRSPVGPASSPNAIAPRSTW